MNFYERAVLAASEQKEVGGGNLIATTANPKAVVEQSKDLNAQLKITLPEGISKADVEIENDYVTQTIYIKFAGGAAPYLKPILDRSLSCRQSNSSDGILLVRQLSSTKSWISANLNSQEKLSAKST